MLDMKLVSVNVGLPKEVSYVDRRGRNKTTTTGIFKQPVSERVMLRTLNLDGDRQADLKGHGGGLRLGDPSGRREVASEAAHC